MSGLRSAARIGAYLITILLAAVWAMDASDSLQRPLYDIGRANVGEIILSLSGTFSLSAAATLTLAHTLAGLKLVVGALLLAAVVIAAYEKLRWGVCDDAMLDVALFVSAFASVAAALPGLMIGGEALRQVIGELMLCIIASALAIQGRGYVAPERPLPRSIGPEPLVIRIK
jgi:hypothetical protein